MTKRKRLNLPKPGFYYHHKRFELVAEARDEDVSLYAYEVRVAYEPRTEQCWVVLRRMYQGILQPSGHDLLVMRPPDFWLKDRVVWSRFPVPRYTKIENQLDVEELLVIRHKLDKASR